MRARTSLFRTLLPLGILVWTAALHAGGQLPSDEKTTTEALKDSSKKAVAWVKKLSGSINLTQTGYSNWAKGGENTIAWSTRVDGDAKRYGPKWSWQFTGILLFGQTKQEGESIRNTLDKIDIDGTISCKTNRYVNPYMSVGVLSQFAKGYDFSKDPPELKSNFWDPAYLTQSLGARVQFKVVNSNLGLGFKQTIARRFTQYSDDPETEKVEKLKLETGLTSKTQVDAKFNTVLTLKSKLELFSAFDDLDAVDLNLDMLLTAKLNKYVVVSLNLLLNYDKDVLRKLQFKEITSVGLSYSFI